MDRLHVKCGQTACEGWNEYTGEAMTCFACQKQISNWRVATQLLERWTAEKVRASKSLTQAA